MVHRVLLLPDFAVFETTNLAVRNNATQNSAPYQLFRECCMYYTDMREKVVYISQEMKEDLKKIGIDIDNKKRLSVYQIVEVHNDVMSQDHFVSIIRLASIVAIDTGKDVYIVTDNEEQRKIINAQQSLHKGAISSQGICLPR